MKVRKKASLVRFNAGPHHPINAASVEYRFMDAMCRGDAEAALSLFEDKKQFSDKLSAVDMPYGRFEGLAGIRECVEGFTARFGAVSAALVPAVQTIANGHAVLELEVHFVVEGEINQVPMMMIADLRGTRMADEIRVYCHHTFVPGLQAYRRPMFKPAHLEMGDPGLLTGSIREYYTALHHTPAVDVERMLRCTSPDCRAGGYGPFDGDREEDGHGDMLGFYQGLATYIPRCVGMRYETLTDDGKTCVIEWVHIVSRDGREERSRIALSGISAYERDENGLLCSVRISDYAGYEKTIDWDQLDITREEAEAMHFVESFPSGCGRKTQDDLK